MFATSSRLSSSLGASSSGRRGGVDGCSPRYPPQNNTCIAKQPLVTSQQRRGRHLAVRAGLNEEEQPVLGDWREFRAKLVMQSQGTRKYSNGRISEDNMSLLEIQDPSLYAEGVWAHPTAALERGGVLIASNEAADILGDDRWWQLVILIISHDASGTVGLILNRPSSLQFGRKKGGLPFVVQDPPGVSNFQETFTNNQVYHGGFVAQSSVHLLHGYRLAGAEEVVPGVFVGGEAAAAAEVVAGRIPANSFKFFVGAVVWDKPGQLEKELSQGAWYTASISRSLLLKQGIRLPVPLWREVLLLMGGQYTAVAADGWEGDE